MNQVAEVIPKYVNQPKPGKRFGSIKDEQGNLYLVQPAMLSLFSPGNPSKFEYTSKTGADGTVWNTVVKVIGGVTSPLPATKNYQARKAPNEARQIFVMALLKELIPVYAEQAQSLPELEANFVAWTEMLKRVYDKTLSGDQTRDDMKDSIGF